MICMDGKFDQISTLSFSHSLSLSLIQIMKRRFLTYAERKCGVMAPTSLSFVAAAADDGGKNT